MKLLVFAVQRNLDVFSSLYEVGLGHPSTTPNAMTSPLRKDALYAYIKRNVRNALDLEYAIRASESVSRTEMSDLKQLQFAIEAFWIRCGASEQETKQEKLTDLAWDTLQVGFPLSRRHSRSFHPELLEVINLGLSSVRQEFATEMKLLTIPAANYYRVCDLLAGNNIPEVISKVKLGLRQSIKYSKEDEIPLKEFSVALRKPIHLHPSFRYGLREENGITTFCFEVDLAGGFDLFQWKRQLNEFQYQYATYRASVFGMHNSITTSLTQDFLEGEHNGTQSEFEIPGLDSFTPSLIGLHCWDLRKREGKSLTKAIAETMKLYELSDETMRRNYRIADRRIKDMAARFQNISK